MILLIGWARSLTGRLRGRLLVCGLGWCCGPGGSALGAFGSLSRGYDPGYLLRESSKGTEGYYLSAVAEIGEPPGGGLAGPAGRWVWLRAPRSSQL